ncbi:MAG: 50S ribosomal protein L37e [Nanoarchaeota archaeon]|nr:50S ribosomal protein L37e [Nanoarchaeota archaeon]
MTKGTPSKGKRAKGTSHMRCRRCGKHSYHRRKKVCASCSYGKSPKLKKQSFTAKKVNRKRVRD